MFSFPFLFLAVFIHILQLQGDYPPQLLDSPYFGINIDIFPPKDHEHFQENTVIYFFTSSDMVPGKQREKFQ